MSELIRVERFIIYFNIADEDMAGEINVDCIPLEKLLNIVTAKEDDPLLYDQYPLDEYQLIEINKSLQEKADFNLGKYVYFLECGGIYDYHLTKE